MADFTKVMQLASLSAVYPDGQKQRSSFGRMGHNAAIPKKHWRFMMKVGDLVVEHIDDRVGTIIEIFKDDNQWVLVLMEDGSIEHFHITYLGRYK